MKLLFVLKEFPVDPYTDIGEKETQDKWKKKSKQKIDAKIHQSTNYRNIQNIYNKLFFLFHNYILKQKAVLRLLCFTP